MSDISPGDAPARVPPDHLRRRYAEILPASDVLALEMLFTLRSTVQVVDNTMARWMGSDAISPGRFQVLALLWSGTDAMPQRDIVAALRVSRATVSDLIEALVREAMVATEPSSTDRRQVLCRLTEEGRAATERLIRSNATRLRESFGGLSDAELVTLTSLLGRLG